MNFSQDWKSYFPVFSSHAPLLVSDSEGSSLGPLIFNPNPQSLTRLFFSSSLLPPPIHIPSALHYNHLEILKYGNGVLLFFPTGNNFERVGYLMVHPEGLDMHVKLNIDSIFQVSSGVYDRILRIVVNPIDNWDESSYIVRYLLVSTRYTVHWFSVCRYGLCLETPRIIHNGGKTFKNCSIVHACWSPHIFNEILVLLQSGELFLFDLEHGKESPPNFKGTRLKWQGSGFSKDTVWVSCEFSWNPRIFIVATSHAVFLVDGTNGTYAVSCLLKIELLQMHAQAQNEKFLALSRAGPDNFYFIVASNNFLLLCDVRKQMMPIIRWSHDLDNPTYINLVSLSQLRSHSRKDTFDLASKTGFCIILGSFFNETFNFFCYGSSLPSEEGSSTLKFSETNKTFYAWELPYEIAISGDYCRCGSCLLTEELSKEELPRGIDWRMKKDMVLGFSILDIDLASCCEQDEYGGFTLIRLMSSGKLELQRYQASWATNKRLKNCNGQGVHFNRYLFSDGDEKYKFRKSSVFLKLDYLCSYSEGNLTKLLVEKLKQKKPLVKDVHDEALCERLKACRVGFSGSSTTIALFEDVKPSSSLYEVAIRGLWAKLPLHILQLAFSKSQKSFASLEFLAVPHLDKLPPFFLRKSSPRSNKCSNKVQHNDDNKSSDEVQHNDDNKNSNEVQHNDDIGDPASDSSSCFSSCAS
ncbi:uncharacterized protein LOC114712365 [Neltuma alba]|uniref:uncharacterized protein LOC114712365 n=1 Tax=Neltuma alba TaxID=207710 RepID=UPI0010A33D89|nr:uncharacterized protein LOC114712365 [Prosopis alba]XP_028752720.1 uncharacterized protein LOC114712365 [Prosopis alba]XP_028752721.1 uncharacterized protein LOC114712365 [Prosopis alba]XP_028752722.1 uncharacterized protein LOC114712365 [Prosopis alba]